MPDNDLISKHLLKRMTLSMARELLGLNIADLELLDTSQQRVEERRMDVAAKAVDEEGGEYILHLETQNDNDPSMPGRMLRYLSDIHLAYPGFPVRQFLVYIGKARLTMPNKLEWPGLNYSYRVLDIRAFSCETLLQLDTPEALVLAILADFGAAEVRTVVRKILRRLQELTGANLAAHRDYLLMLEHFSGNRDLKNVLKEEEAMLSQIKLTELPSYELGVEKGLEKGEALLLQKLLAKRFDPLPAELTARIAGASAVELEQWFDRAMDAGSLDEVFG